MIQFQSKPINVQFEDLNLIFGPSLSHVSREGSFLGQNRHKASARGGNYDESEIDQQMESDGSDSSYDSTNAFNVYQHSLRFK